MVIGKHRFCNIREFTLKVSRIFNCANKGAEGALIILAGRNLVLKNVAISNAQLHTFVLKSF